MAYDDGDHKWLHHVAHDSIEADTEFEASSPSSILINLGLGNASEHPDDKATDIVVELSHSSWIKRLAALQKIAGHPDALPVDMLLKVLRDDHPAVRAAAARTLTRYKLPLPTEPFVEALQDPSWLVRATAINVLAKQEKIPLDALIHTLQDEDETVRANAIWAISTLRAHAPVEPLVAALQDTSWSVREAAAKALGEIGSRVPLEPLLAASKDSDSNVRAAALQALQQIYPESIATAHTMPPHLKNSTTVEAASSKGHYFNTIESRSPMTAGKMEHTIKHVPLPKAKEAFRKAQITTVSTFFKYAERSIAIAVLVMIILSWLMISQKMHTSVGSNATSTIFSYHSSASNGCAILWLPQSTRTMQNTDQIIAFTDRYSNIEIWDITTQQKIRNYTPFGKVLAINWATATALNVAYLNAQQSVVLVHAGEKKAFTTMSIRGNVPSIINWEPDGKAIAIATSSNSRSTIQVFHLTQDSPHITTHQQTGTITAMAWTTNGQNIASASDQNTIDIWNATTGQSVLSSTVPVIATPYHVAAMSWSPDNNQNLAYALTDGTIYYHNIGTGSDTPLVSTTNGSYWSHPQQLQRTALSWSSDGKKLAVATPAGKIQVWDYLGNLLFTFNGHSAQVNDISWSSDNRYIASSSIDGTLLVWALPF